MNKLTKNHKTLTKIFSREKDVLLKIVWFTKKQKSLHLYKLYFNTISNDKYSLLRLLVRLFRYWYLVVVSMLGTLIGTNC